MPVLFFAFTIMLSLSNAQDYIGSDNVRNERNSYGNISDCIGKYRDLEKYVLNNENLMDNLTEVYFKTGKSSARFVRITYKFKILLPNTNSTNETVSNETDDGEFICVDNQKMFIWSSSALYLLGPEPLFWLTLFAVNVLESSVTVQLPCLCIDAYDNLLSRLTYLIKVYPAMQFQCQTMQFISTYFFETKAPLEDNYNAIVKIFSLSIYLPCATWFVFSYLIFFYSDWVIKFVEKYVADGKEKVRRKRSRERNSQYIPLRGSTDDDLDKVEEEKEKTNRRIKIAALILVSICLTIALFVFHVIASVKLIQYGNEVLNDVQNIRANFDLKVRRQDENDQPIPILYAVFSFLPVIFLIGFILLYFCRDSSSQSVDEALGKYLRLSLGVLLVYLGFCFLMYMVLAIINDPIATGFVYLIGILCILCVYLLSNFLCLTVMLFATRIYNIRSPSCCADWVYVVFTQLSGISLGYFLIILIFILTLGNFHDFQAVQNLTLPIIIALLSFFVLKPIFKSIKKSVKIDTTDPEANVNNADHDHTNGTANEDN